MRRSVPLSEVGEEIQELQDASTDYRTDEALAARLSVTSMTVWNWKSGRSPIPPVYLDTIRMICKPDPAGR